MLALLLFATGCAAAHEGAKTAGDDQAARTARQADQARAAQVEQLLSNGRTLASQHRPREAEAPLRQAITLAWGFGSPWSHYRARGLSELARALLADGRAAEARTAVERALALLKPGALADDQQLSELETTRAEAFRREQQPAAAIAPFTVAVQAAERHPAQLAPARIAISLRLAETLEALGRRQDAKQVLQRAEPVAKPAAVGAELSGRLRDALAAFEATRTVERPVAIAGTNTTLQVAAMQAEFRACYNASVAEERAVSGQVALVISIAADGHVSNVKTAGTGLPATTVDCLVQRAAVARFEPPKGGSAVITVPVTFVKQEND